MKTATTLSTDALAWRALGRFWAGLLTTAALGAAILTWLGPPQPVTTGAEQPHVFAAETTPAADARPAPDTSSAPGAEAVAEQPAARPEPPRPAAPEAPAPARAEEPPAPSLPDRLPASATPQLPAARTSPLPRVITPTAPPEAAAPVAQAPVAAPAPQPVRPSAPVPPATAAPAAHPPPAALPLPAGGAPGPLPAPDPGLMEASRHGPLPRIGPDGRSPARLYARAFDRSQPGPRVALLIGGVGLSIRLAEEAIARLPPEVSLALSPYAPGLDPILTAARARGIETLMSLPFEPQGWPLNDPGDRAMLTGLPMEQNLDRMFWALSRAQGQIGVVGALGPLRGERFAAQPGALEAVQRILASRGLIYVDPRPGAPGPGFAWGLAVDLVLDEPAGAAAIDSRLAALEARARERGSAVGYAGDPSPVLVARVAAWAEGLARRGVVLAPVSAMIRRPEPR